MSERKDSRKGDRLFAAVASFLVRPFSDLACLIGWIGSSIVFLGFSSIIGGPSEGDAAVSVYSTWAVAHGRLACAYPATTTFHFPSIADPYTYIAPLYPLLSGAVASLTRIGHAVPFPNANQMGPTVPRPWWQCSNWSSQSGAILPTVRIGYICWLPLMIGAIFLIRSAGRGKSGWEIVALFLLALLPPVMECLTDYFHPQDLLALAFVLMATAASCEVDG